MEQLTINKGKVKILLISDTHYGSPAPFIDAHILKPLIKENKYDMMFHLGDIINGRKKEEQTEKIVKKQLVIAKKQFSKIEMPKYFITGNHDHYGMNDGNLFDGAFSNSKWLGKNDGYIKINNQVINLCHLTKRMAIYSPTVKKFQTKPHILIQGHYHMFRCVEEMDILRINLPCFSNVLTFSKRGRGVADLTIDFENKTYQVRNYSYTDNLEKVYDLKLSYKY